MSNKNTYLFMVKHKMTDELLKVVDISAVYVKDYDNDDIIKHVFLCIDSYNQFVRCYATETEYISEIKNKVNI